MKATAPMCNAALTLAAPGLYLGFGTFAAADVPVLFGAMGFSAVIAGPSRDLLVKRSTPDIATGRVYGMV